MRSDRLRFEAHRSLLFTCFFSHCWLCAKGVSGGDAPFLAGVVEPLPQAGRSSVGRRAILVVKYHAAVLDDEFIVAAARWNDLPLLTKIAQRRPQIGRCAVR